MFELGNESPKEHKELIDSLLDENSIQCFFIGSAFYDNRIDKSNFYFYDSFDAFSNYLKKIQIRNSIILIKGSRGMALERTLDFLL